MFLAGDAQNRYKMERQQSLPAMLFPVKQHEAHFGGPAIAEAVLRYWDLPPLRLGIKSEDGYQRLLARDEFMAADSNGGTNPDDWIRSVNHIMMSYGLNERRQYSKIEITAGYSNVQEFFDIVSRSLVRNVPVALAFVAQSSDSLASLNPRHSFILITSASGTAESAMYNYLDPTDGIIRQFDNSFLSFLSVGDINQQPSMPSFIISNIDTTDQTFLNSLAGNGQMQTSDECNFLTILTSVCQNMGRSKRTAYRPTTCVAVDAMNPLSNYADYIHVLHKLIGRNGIQVKLSRPTAMTLERFFVENDRNAFLRYAESLLTRVVQKGTVLDSDRSHAAQVMYDGMPYIHEKTLAMLRDDDMRAIFVQTYRAYNFHETVKSIGVDGTVYISDHPSI